MADREYTDRFSFDFSQATGEIEKLRQLLQNWKFDNEAIERTLDTMTHAIDGSVLKISKATAEGDKLTATFKRVDDSIEVMAQSIGVATKAYDTLHSAETAQIQLHAALAESQRRGSEITIQALADESRAYREMAQAAETAQNKLHAVLIDSRERSDASHAQNLATEIQQAAAEEDIFQRKVRETLSILEREARVYSEIEAAESARFAAAFRVGNAEAEANRTAEATAEAERRQATALQQVARYSELALEEDQHRLATELAIARAQAQQGYRNTQNQQAIDFAALREAERATRATAENSQGILISWQSFVRLLIVQSIHQVVYRIVDAMRAAVSEAEKLEIRISEIRTISQANQLSFDQWTAGVRRLSDAFGTDVLDVAEAAYQTLSNRVATGAETFAFMSTALQFSQVTLASAKDSVNLLTSALNSFHLQTSEADRVASVFFNTIQDGRIRADELAGVFGRVGPLAHSLGLSLEETTAALATMTINGVPANEAMTLLNNVMVHLLKPSKDLKELFDQLGVSGAETAVATFGFSGLLQKLQDRTGGASEATAELFKEIRDLRGALGLTGENLKRFSEDYKDMTNLAPFDLAKKLAIESAGKQFEIEINKIKNFFVNDFGRPFLETAASISSTIKELENLFKSDEVVAGLSGMDLAEQKLDHSTGGLVDLLGELIKLVISAGEAWLAYVVVTNGAELAAYALSGAVLSTSEALGTATVAATTFEGTFPKLAGIFGFISNPVVLTIAAIAGLILEIKHLGDIEDEAFAKFATLEQDAKIEAEKLTKGLKEELDNQDRNFEESMTRRFQLLLQATTEVNKLLTNTAAYQTDIFKVTAANSKDAIRELVQESESLVGRLNRQLGESNSLLETIRGSIEETVAGIHNTQFEHSLKLLPEPEQVDTLFKDINKQIAFANSTNFKPAQAGQPGPTVEEIKTDRKEHLDAENQAELDRTKIIEAQVKAERELKETGDQIAELEKRKSAHGVRDEEKDHVRQLRDLHQELLELSKKHGSLEKQKAAEIEKQIRALEATVSTGNEAESAREIDVRLENAKKKHTEAQATLDAIQKGQNLEQLGATLQQQKLDNERKYQKILDDEIAATNAKLVAEKKILELRKDLEATIDKVKVPKSIETGVAGQQFIHENFDIPIFKALQGGALDQDRLRVLNANKQAAVDIINTQIQEKAEKENNERVIQDRNRIEAARKLETKAIKDAQDSKVAAAEQIQAAFGKLDKYGNVVESGALSSLAGNIVERNGRGTEISTTISAEDIAKKGQDFLEKRISAAELQKFTDLILKDSPAAGVFLGQFRTGAADKQADLLTNASNKILNAARQFEKSGPDLEAATKAKEASDKEIERNNLTLAASTNQTVAIKSNTETIHDLTLEVVKLTTETNNLYDELKRHGADNFPVVNPLAPPSHAAGTMAGGQDVDTSGRIKSDNTLAMLHAGEIVLNKRQSASLLQNHFDSGTLSITDDMRKEWAQRNSTSSLDGWSPSVHPIGIQGTWASQDASKLYDSNEFREWKRKTFPNFNPDIPSTEEGRIAAAEDRLDDSTLKWANELDKQAVTHQEYLEAHERLNRATEVTLKAQVAAHNPINWPAEKWQDVQLKFSHDRQAEADKFLEDQKKMNPYLVPIQEHIRKALVEDLTIQPPSYAPLPSVPKPEQGSLIIGNITLHITSPTTVDGPAIVRYLKDGIRHGHVKLHPQGSGF